MLHQEYLVMAGIDVGRREFSKDDITDEHVETVEDAVSMGCNAWDMVDPKELIAASANVMQAIAPSLPNPQATGGAEAWAWRRLFTWFMNNGMHEFWLEHQRPNENWVEFIIRWVQHLKSQSECQ